MAKQPEWFGKLKREYPGVLSALDHLGVEIAQAGPLDNKSAHLIRLAAAAASGSEGAVHSHVRRALEVGASGEEIRHAILLLTSTIGFPRVSAALKWADDLLDG